LEESNEKHAGHQHHRRQHQWARQKLSIFQEVLLIQSRARGLFSESRQPPKRHRFGRDKRLGDLPAVEIRRQQVGRDSQGFEARRHHNDIVENPIAVA
jgi:hypothetical protein